VKRSISLGLAVAFFVLTAVPLSSHAQFRPIGAAQGSYTPPTQPPVSEPPTVEFEPDQQVISPAAEHEPAANPALQTESAAPPPDTAPAQADSNSPQPSNASTAYGAAAHATTAAETELFPPATQAAAKPTPGDLWERIRRGFALGDMGSPLVRRHERAFAAQNEYVLRIVDRSRRYLYHIVEEVAKRGMPMEVALLPIVESAFNPRAYSRARASGIWQFMPDTGKHFGLQQNWWQDERRDVHAATDAALDYLMKLHRRFGNWELALAAYNSGEGRVARAVANNRAAGRPTSFSHLRLPRETRNYVPKLMAVKNLVLNPDRYGITLNAIPDAPYFAVVTTDKNLDLKRAAELAEISVDEFAALNPAYNRPVIAAHGERNILVPAEVADIFSAKLQNPDQPLLTWRTHQLKRGESLDRIADKFGISAAELREVNGIPSARKVAGGGSILVPSSELHPVSDMVLDSSAVPEAAVAAPRLAAATAATHRVRRGETLSSIARRYGVSVALLKARNGVRGNNVRAGQALHVREAGLVRTSLNIPARRLARTPRS
jgi:membrane-bound lytic murein transglycosylase D